MNNASPAAAHVSAPLQRVAAIGSAPSKLADVYNDEVNIAIWQRRLEQPVRAAVQNIMDSKRVLGVSMTTSPGSVQENIAESLGGDNTAALAADAAGLVQMFCELFDLKRVGLRLVTLDKAMCPRFHTDMVPCRLLTTYCGIATQWLPHAVVDRSKLGSGSGGRPDAETGLYTDDSDIQRVEAGHVALLKGDGWIGNEGGGLVHRSPQVPIGQARMLLTVDFSR